MGYYTTYKLTLFGPQDAVVAAWLDKVKSYECTLLDITSSGATKWYDHDDDMILLSKRHPEVGFLLKGDGEEQGDVWATYYFRGHPETFRMEPWVPPPCTMRGWPAGEAVGSEAARRTLDAREKERAASEKAREIARLEAELTRLRSGA